MTANPPILNKKIWEFGVRNKYTEAGRSARKLVAAPRNLVYQGPSFKTGCRSTVVVRILGKDEVGGSIPLGSTIFLLFSPVFPEITGAGEPAGDIASESISKCPMS